MRLRIAQVNADRGISPGGTKGASLHLRGVAAGLARAGHLVETFSARKPEGQFVAPVHPLSELETRDDMDVIYERYSLGHEAGLARARALDVPFVLEVNAPLVDEANRHRPHTVSPADRAIEEHLIAAADLVIAVSTDLARWILPHRDGPTIVQANGFEPSWFPPARPPTRAADVEFPLVFLGHPKPWHGADRLISLLERLARAGHRPRMLVVGGGPGASELETQARRFGLGSQLEITGTLPPAEAAAHLRRTAIGLAPYRTHEPFYFCPLKIVDYLAAGLAVVSTNQGDVSRLVGDAGVVLDDPDDDDRLASAVLRLLEDDEVRRRMARAGQRRAHATMTWRAVAEATVTAMDRAQILPTDRLAGSAR